jgi:hypothetical protein
MNTVHASYIFISDARLRVLYLIILFGDADFFTQIILLEGKTGGWLCTCKIRETKRP